MVNLTDGGYVSKDKYTNLETDLSGKTTELTKANNLIEELKSQPGKTKKHSRRLQHTKQRLQTLRKRMQN